MKFVNIVITAYNRLEHTVQTIESLFANTHFNLFDAYIVDDVSTDGTREKLLELNQKYPFTLILNDENIGPGAGKNYACEIINDENNRHEFLYISDNDVFFKSGWLDDMIYAFRQVEDKKVKLLGGGCHPYLRDNFSINTENYRVGVKDAVSGYSHLMRWETFDKYGPYADDNRNSDMKIMGSEDWALCRKIVEDGYLVGSLYPEVVIATGKTNTYGNKATGYETFNNFDGILVK